MPLIIKQEGNAGAGRRVADLVQHIDLVPTILDLVKAPGAGNLRGRSLKPLLEGTGTLPPADDLLGGAVRALSLRLERADRAHRRALPLHQGAARGALRPRRAIRASGPTSPTSGRSRGRRCAARSIAWPPARRSRRRPTSRPTRANGCRRSATSARRPTCSTKPGDALPDPKDKREILERYRAAVDLAGQRKWPQAIALLQQILRDDPEMADVWSQLAVFATRHRSLRPRARRLQALHRAEAAGADRVHRRGGGAAEAAQAGRGARAREPGGRGRGRQRTIGRKASAHEMLAKIALAKHDTDAAREEARLAREADPTLPLPIYIDARLLYDQGKYADALPGFLTGDRRAEEVGHAADQRAALLHRRHAGAPRALSRGGAGVHRGAASTSRRTSARAAGWRCSTRRATSRTPPPRC